MDEEEVRKRTLLYEIEDELWVLLKRRAWILAVVLAIVGASGIWAVVHYTVQQVADGPLKDLQKQLVQAEIQAESAKRANATATTAAEQVTSNLNGLQGSVQTLREQAKSISDQFALVTQQIEASSKNAALRSQRDFNAAQERIAALETLVKRIAEDNAATRKATADYAKQVAALENKVEKEQKRFAENSAYSVSIFSSSNKRSLALDVQRLLAGAGFRAALVDFPVKSDKNTLTYDGKSDSKAKELLALIAPIVKDVELKTFKDVLSAVPYKGLAIDPKIEALIGGITFRPFISANTEVNTFSITLGG